MREIHLRNVRIAQLAIFTLSRCISLLRVVASMYVGIRGAISSILVTRSGEVWAVGDIIHTYVPSSDFRCM